MNRTLLARATEGTAAPTPGYLYKDLAQAAASNPSAALDMAQYLTNRLQSKSNPNIKFKCLKVISKLCEEVPRNQFRRCISQNSQGVAAIKEAVHFRGPPDPVRGDEPNQKVRTAAQEALDAVYREASSSEMVGAVGLGGAAGSYAPSPHSAMPSSMTGAGRRMEGIGNPRYQDPRLDPRFNNGLNNITIQDAVREAGEVVLGIIKDPLARNVEVNVHTMNRVGNLPGYGSNPYHGRPPPGSAELSRQTGGQWTMASNRGPGSIVHNEEYYKARDSSYQWTKQPGTSSTGHHSGGVGGSWAAASPERAGVAHALPSVNNVSNAMVGNGTSKSVGLAASDGTYEKNLILELCPPGGMKPVPPPDKLANFKRIVPTLNPDLVCPVLLDCLEEGQPWIIRAKSLCVMEACIEAGSELRDGNPYRDFFFTCADEITPLAEHARSAIKEPARRVLNLLGLEQTATATPYSSEPAAAQMSQASTLPNLLEFDNDDAQALYASQTPPPTPAPSLPVQVQSTASVHSSTNAALFGGMQLKQKNDAVSSASNGVKTQPELPAPVSGNLLDFSNPSPTNNGSSHTNDIFQELNGNPVSNHPTSMFGQMNIKENAEDKKAHSEDISNFATATESSSAGSAFQFMNGSSSGDHKSQQDSTQHLLPLKQSFDPLLTTATSVPAALKPMQLSAEQMQAMAYQQMMMQQQMQQQMQMAYAMQARAGNTGSGTGLPVFPNRMMMPPGMTVVPPMVAASSNHRNSVTSGFSFKDAPRPAQKDDKKFDFVKDAMQTESKKH